MAGHSKIFRNERGEWEGCWIEENGDMDLQMEIEALEARRRVMDAEYAREVQRLRREAYAEEVQRLRQQSDGGWDE